MTDNKLTDKEIIKALECCDYPTDDLCCECCFKSEENCTGKLTQATVDLINRQQAENKELKTENLILSQKRFNIFERIEFTDKLKKQAKSEAIKEFAGKLTDIFYSHDKGDTYVREVVYNLVKEMAGEQG